MPVPVLGIGIGIGIGIDNPNRGAVTSASLGFQPEVSHGDIENNPAAERRQVAKRTPHLSPLRGWVDLWVGP
ncbi:hypothetical protein [Rhodopirellula sp. P2]|uniref:hypothetical protein n=1 Tax=Rhodopirellula sp. P2 TaxID=2127060 RepID=UPI0023675205|nr:hypothetical protein [Rhodopirellula sp. P2]WDQ18018.1 hypothetical protein PSR62_05550 [Rhodopirellula sp. P2]